MAGDGDFLSSALSDALGLSEDIPSRQPFSPPSRSSFRERFLEQNTRRAAALHMAVSAELIQARQNDLSPVYIRSLEDRLDQIEGFASKAPALLERVRRQSSELDADETYRALHPSRDRDFSLYRSTRDRNAAIAGVLDRERRRNAPVSRAALERAKALAAARRSFREARGLPKDFDYTSLLPCVEADARQRVRRQVMFAHGFAARGYSTAKRKRVC